MVVDDEGEGNTRPDFTIRTRNGHSIAIEVKWAGEGWPEDVRRAAAGVPKRWPADVVLLARRLSPGAIEWLRDRGANWADEAGQARIQDAADHVKEQLIDPLRHPRMATAEQPDG